MKTPVTKVPNTKSFLDLPILSDWSNLNHKAVVFGAPFGKPYNTQDFPNNQSTAPDRLRDASPRILIDQHAMDLDLETESTLASISVADGGNIPLRDNDIDQHYSEIEGAVRYLVDRGVLSVSIGGDDGITNPVLRGLDPLNEVTVIQIDAHMDWKNERFGERDGYSSPMRRASEMAHISGIHQVGIRSYGSATAQDFKDAKDCFPGNPPKGGVCYFLWDKNYDGECEIFSHEKGKITLIVRMGAKNIEKLFPKILNIASSLNKISFSPLLKSATL